MARSALPLTAGEQAVKWGCITLPFIAIAGLVAYSTGAINFQKAPDPNRLFADHAMASARDAMKDPTSVKFKDLRVSAKAKCMYGKILAKNGFGAYSGYQNFVWINGKTYIDPGELMAGTIINNLDEYEAYIHAYGGCTNAMPSGVDSLPLQIPEA